MVRQSGAELIVTVDGRTRVVDLDCPVEDVLRRGSEVLVACGPAGVVVMRLGPRGELREVERRPVSGRAMGLFLDDGQVRVEVARETVEPLAPREDATPDEQGTAGPDGGDAATTPRFPEGRGDLVDPDALAPVPEPPGAYAPSGARTASGEPVPSPPAGEAGGPSSPSDRGEAPRGPPPARPAGEAGGPSSPSDRGEAPRGPPPARPAWEIGVGSAAILRSDDPGAGVLHRVMIRRRFDAPLAITLDLGPLGWVFDRDETTPNPVGGLATATVALDGDWFGVGVGVGYGTENTRGEAGLALAQSLRLGSVRGPRLTVDGAFYVLGSGAAFAMVRGEAVLPFGPGGVWGLAFRGGGGRVGWGYGTVGLRQRVLGGGDQGEVVIGVNLGGGVVFESFEAEGRIDAPGLLVGLEAIWIPGGGDADRAGPDAAD